MIRYLFIVTLCLYTRANIYCQENIPLNTWRTHLSFNGTKDIAVVSGKVFCASASGLFSFDQSDNSLTKLTKIDGLSDVQISSISSTPDGNALYIGYESGAVDLIENNEITGFDLIRELTFADNKRINDAIFGTTTAYFTTSFGMVSFDLASRRFIEIFQELGESGQQIAAFTGVILRDTIFLATEQGVIGGPLDGTNLLDFDNWRRFDLADGLPAVPTRQLERYNERLYAGVDNLGLYRYESGVWEKETFFDGARFTGLSASGEKLLIVADGVLWDYDGVNNPVRIEDVLIGAPANALYEQDAVWIADGVNGLVTNFSGSFQSIFPSGPFSDSIWKLYYHEGKMYGVSGGYAAGEVLDIEAGYYLFQNGSWDNFNASGSPNATVTPPVNDLVDVVFSSELDALYFASFRSGLMILKEEEFSVFSGPPLMQSFGRLKISSLAVDENGLWVANYGVAPSVHLLKPDGLWESFAFGVSEARSTPLEIVISTFGDKWIRLDPGEGAGILVLNSATGEQRFLNEESNSGQLPSVRVNDMVLDKDGFLWVGTDRGVAFFPNTGQVFDGVVSAVTPIFDNRPLLRDDRVTVIEVDGGNRKWVGTPNGLWLFDENGEELIHNFTTENSPLISNDILDIEINPVSGEVFIATAKGIISFRGDATEAGPVHGNVKIFPNPVTRDFVGSLSINGLAANAIVKITDISGKLIWQTRANGGTATWGVADYNGRRAATGMYLVFSATDDGEDTFVGKIAVVD